MRIVGDTYIYPYTNGSDIIIQLSEADTIQSF
jgi:hypothetical protein